MLHSSATWWWWARAKKAKASKYVRPLDSARLSHADNPHELVHNPPTEKQLHPTKDCECCTVRGGERNKYIRRGPTKYMCKACRVPLCATPHASTSITPRKTSGVRWHVTTTLTDWTELWCKKCTNVKRCKKNKYSVLRWTVYKVVLFHPFGLPGLHLIWWVTRTVFSVHVYLSVLFCLSVLSTLSWFFFFLLI